MNIIRRIEAALLYPMAKTIVTTQSEIKRIKTIGQSAKVILEKEYTGQPILMLALYQTGSLRPDILRLIAEAKELGFYVFAINTLKLKPTPELENTMDCYIERPNFGRDFGSYKSGYAHFFRKKYHNSCPRLVMANDSVYYSVNGLNKFLLDLKSTDVDVLGATENYEIEHHLGSFCISIGKVVLNNKKFQNFWKGYKLSDVRRVVIKKGEMKLSKTLKRCVSDERNFRALYGASRIHDEMKNSDDYVDIALKLGRRSNLVDWPKLEIPGSFKQLEDKLVYNFDRVSDSEHEFKLDLRASEWTSQKNIFTQQDLIDHVLRNIENVDAELEKEIKNHIIFTILNIFRFGSHIHQNASLLFYTGLPIIKLDLLYRGMHDLPDFGNLLGLMTEEEQKELFELMIRRPHGFDTYVGWRRAAFMRGLI